MKKILKWLAIILGGLLGAIVVAALVLLVTANMRLNKSYDVVALDLNVPENSISIDDGAYIVSTTCVGCHGENLAGTRFFDEAALAFIPAPNLTSGIGGSGLEFNDADWVRAIRYGVNPEGRPLMIMPSKAFWNFSDQDLASLIAYIKSVDPVNNNLGEKSLKPMGKILMAAGAFGDVLAAETLDADSKPPAVVKKEISTNYGEYLVNTRDCRACHGAALNGGQSAEPGAPLSPDLSPNGALGNWKPEHFIETLRTGQTPYGKNLDSAYMPYKEYGLLTDEDLTAIFMFLQSLP